MFSILFKKIKTLNRKIPLALFSSEGGKNKNKVFVLPSERRKHSREALLLGRIFAVLFFLIGIFLIGIAYVFPKPKTNDTKIYAHNILTGSISPFNNLPPATPPRATGYSKDREINNKNQKEDYYLVVKIVDGDTIDIDINGATKRLRLIGMDAPETTDPRKTIECFGKESLNKASEILFSKKVRLESDSTQNDKDKYGRLLRYVYREDGLFYNEWMIKNGYAHEYTYITSYKYRQKFKQAEDCARKNKLGLWRPDACDFINKKTQNKITAIQAIKKNSKSQPNKVSGHIFYTSKHFMSKLYYCDTDLIWKNLSKKYLESYASEAELLKKYPDKTLHKSCGKF